METLVFKRSGLYLGIEIEFIRQVVDDVAIAPVPLAPPGYTGLIYHRGELFEVADLGVIIKKEKAVKSKSALKILLKWNQKGIALAADEIIGLKSLKNNNEPEKLTFEGKPIKIITPEGVWKMLSELPYGPCQI
jgi:chemotaxis signal transduction protein